MYAGQSGWARWRGVNRARRDGSRQVVPPGVPQQPLGVAQGQAVVRLGEIGKQHVRRAPRERAAQSGHRLCAALQAGRATG